jgi:spore coat polysaccharide biosynthesis protein SpsF (cytidylyltransferase family)
MRTVAIIQARMGSTRLPGKVLLPLAGKTVLAHIVDRTRAARRIDDVWVATTDSAEDDPTASATRSYGASVFRGSAEDVLDRYRGAAAASAAEIVVRVTADDPLKDPDIIDQVVELRDEVQADYASNTIEPTYPEGLDVEVFTIDALTRACEEATSASDREHVTPYMYRHPERFRLASLTDTVDRSDMRWTLDYEDDLDFLEEVYAHLYRGRVFGANDVFELLQRRPDLMSRNRGHMRNEGYLRSLGLRTDRPRNEAR